jgi:hypothetical protein
MNRVLPTKPQIQPQKDAKTRPQPSFSSSFKENRKRVRSHSPHHNGYFFLKGWFGPFTSHVPDYINHDSKFTGHETEFTNHESDFINQTSNTTPKRRKNSVAAEFLLLI